MCADVKMLRSAAIRCGGRYMINVHILFFGVCPYTVCPYDRVTPELVIEFVWYYIIRVVNFIAKKSST